MKVKDHDHITGIYQVSAYQEFNLNLKISLVQFILCKTIIHMLPSKKLEYLFSKLMLCQNQ